MQDSIAKGAYKQSILTRPRCPLLWSHQTSEVIGICDVLSEDDYGLAVRGRILETTKGLDTIKLLEGGAVDGLSIGYNPVKTSRLPGGIRRLDVIDLREISVVALPADSYARISLTEQQQKHLKDLLEVEFALQCMAEGVKMHPRQLPEAIEAMLRENERLEFGGLTRAESEAKLRAELRAELKR